LLQDLAGTTDRRCAFVSTLVALRSADDPEPLVAVGRWPGEILAAPRGDGGFGYDPLMWIAGESSTVAELASERKNAISHRGRAVARLRELMRDAWHMG
jgi:XTP/dITP diphosphohydrolase